jgi:hypothetical protein
MLAKEEDDRLSSEEALTLMKKEAAKIKDQKKLNTPMR